MIHFYPMQKYRKKSGYDDFSIFYMGFCAYFEFDYNHMISFFCRFLPLFGMQ